MVKAMVEFNVQRSTRASRRLLKALITTARQRPAYRSSFPEAPNLLFTRTMSGLAKAAPALKPFTLALIQLGNVGSNKADNLKHAREMIKKAVTDRKKPDLVVLPVRITATVSLSIVNEMVLKENGRVGML